MKLERGTAGFLDLKEGEIKYYVFRHIAEKKGFKILSLHRYGHVQMYLNKTTPQKVLELANTEINYASFALNSPYQNRLVVEPESAIYCSNCYYILAVVATKHTVSTIFLGDDETLLPLSSEKVVIDILEKSGQSTKGSFYPI